MVINGKEYRAPEIDFNLVCDMGDLGVDIYAISEKPLQVLRGFLAIAGNMNLAEAGAEINAHIVGGGDLKEINKELTEAFNNSGFFNAMVDRAKKASEPEPTKASKK